MDVFMGEIEFYNLYLYLYLYISYVAAPPEQNLKKKKNFS